MKLFLLAVAVAIASSEDPKYSYKESPAERKARAIVENGKFYTFNYVFTNQTENSEYLWDLGSIQEELPWPLNYQGLSLPQLNPLIRVSANDCVDFGYPNEPDYPWFVLTCFFFQTHWEIPLIAVTLYSLMITLGPKIIKTPIKPRTTMACWNASLAIFSWIGLFNVLPALLFGRDYETNEGVGVLVTDSFYKNICTDAAWYGLGKEGFWVIAFILSKIPELVDTLWLVLAKCEVILLHWYHHISVLLFCWHAYAERASLGIHFCCMNYTVHGIMYSYYAMTQWSMETRKIVKPYAIYITILQIVQMMGGIFFVCSAAFYKYALGYECHNTTATLVAAFAMYTSYFLLFFQLFYSRYEVVQQYLGGSKKKAKRA